VSCPVTPSLTCRVYLVNSLVSFSTRHKLLAPSSSTSLLFIMVVPSLSMMCKSKMFVVAFVTFVACSLLVVPAAEARSTVAFKEENLKTNQYSLQDTIQGNMHRRFLADGDNKTVAGPNLPSLPAKSCKVVKLPKYEDNWNEVILKFNENDVSKECLHVETFTEHFCLRQDGSTCTKKISEVSDLCTDTDVNSQLEYLGSWNCDSNTGKCSFASNSYWTNENGKCAAEPVILVMKNTCEPKEKEIPETSTEVTLRDVYTICEWGSDVANAVATILIVVIVVIVIAVLGGIACCCFCCSGCPGYKCCHKQQPPVMVAQPGVMMQPMQPGMSQGTPVPMQPMK